MKQDETEQRLPEAGNPERQGDGSVEDIFRKASQIEHIDDSQLPQSIKDLFRK